MKTQFKIREATKQDVPIILDLIKQFAEYGNVSHELKATEEILQESLFGSKPYAEVLLGFIDKKPISYALFTHNFSTLLGKPGLYLVDLFVVAEARNKEIGRRMLAEIIKIANKRKCCRIEGAVLKSNILAKNFYKSIHAQPMHDWEIYRLTQQDLDTH